jgi:lipopolysaccharide/colanic/teichoic acid biosynthesis glycosyltransferase
MSRTQFAQFQRSMQDEAVLPYCAHLAKRRVGLFFKRAFDIFGALLMIVLLSPFFLLSAVLVKTTKGPVFYRQLRVGRDCRALYIYKFRTMVVGADKSGELTVGGDARVTGVGKILRATNFDEAPQLFSVLFGSMSIVGVRPEVPRYVAHYAPGDFATLLLKPGLTSPVAIKYRHESALLSGCDNPEQEYIQKILPAKMEINRSYVANFSFLGDMRIIGQTFKCFFEKDDIVQK